MKIVKTKYFKWYKKPVEGTRVEVTKDYFADGDEYINSNNGWFKLEDHFIEFTKKEKDDKEKVQKA